MSRALVTASLWFAVAAGAAAQLPPVPVPAGNPVTADKANLGWTLFWDEQLSSTRTVACGTCHIPAAGGSDPRSREPGSIHPGADGVFGTEDDVVGSRGVIGNVASGAYRPTPLFGLAPQVTDRKTPTVINAAYHASFTLWDGRASGKLIDPLTGNVVLPENAALESQVLLPPVSDVEMAHEARDWQDAAARIAQSRPVALATDVPAARASWLGQRSYPELFAAAFGTPDVTPVRIAMAIATYERTLIADRTPWDDFVAGNNAALTPLEQQGLALYTTGSRCRVCHPFPLFVREPDPAVPFGGIFFNTGVRPPAEDPGLAKTTGNPADRGKFKIPTLRNAMLRAPFFHNGSVQTMAEIVEFYDRGGEFNENKALEMRRLNLSSQEKQALVAFLENALTDPRVAAELPPFDRPTLYSESARAPATYGTAGAGSGGIAPRMIAEQPPLLGNPSLTLALADALGGAQAVLLVGTAAAPSGATLLGIPLHVSPVGLGVAALGALTGTGAGSGHASVSFAVPTMASLAGTSLYVQGFALDPGAAPGLAGTAGTQVTLFAPR